MGSGTLAAMSVLESRWVPDMSEEDAKQLVRDAIRAGIFNDMGSGSYVDLVVIKPKDDVQYLRTFEKPTSRVSAARSTHTRRERLLCSPKKSEISRLGIRTTLTSWIPR